MERQTPTFEEFFALITTMPGAQQIFLILFLLVSTIGGNYVVIQHYKRRGMSWTSIFNPFEFPFKHFSRNEWLKLISILGLAMAFGVIALYSGS